MASSAAERRLVEGYLVELQARAKATQNRCTDLLSRHYISTTPTKLAKAIRELCGALGTAATEVVRHIDWDDPAGIDPDVQILRSTDTLIQQLAAQMRYVEAAQTERLPWSIVRSFDKFVERLIPGVDIMLRPQWNYNYASHISDLSQIYRDVIAEYAEFLDADATTRALSELDRPFHILTFPALERRNILLHSLLGHELGHLLISGFVNDAARQAFVVAILPELRRLTKAHLGAMGLTERSAPLFEPTAEKEILTQYTNQALAYWERAIEELLSDVAGAILFGPAALFSTLDMAMQQGFDLVPTEITNYYPPWRMRLRTILTVLEEPGVSPFFPVSADLFKGPGGPEKASRVNELYEFIVGLVRKEADVTAIGRHQIAKLAYERLVKPLIEGREFLLNECALVRHRLSSRRLYAYLPDLLERLDHGVPPNAIELSVDDLRCATMAGIINAASFFKASLGIPILNPDGALNEEVGAAKHRLNNLTLKAIEIADLSLERGTRYEAVVDTE